MVSNAAFNGAYDKNPMNFLPYNITKLTVMIDGQSFPSRPMRFDFENDNYMEGWMALFDSTGTLFTNEGPSIPYKDFADGNTLFLVNTCPETKRLNGCASPRKNGNLRIDMEFSKPLTESIALLVYAIFENEISISASREVALDY